MNLFNAIFRRGAKQAANDDLNAVVKSDLYVDAGDMEKGQGENTAPSNPNCCMSAFKSVCLKSPFGIFCATAAAFNVPPIILALTDLDVLGKGCHASIWLLVNGICACVHITVALYIAFVSVVPPPTKQERLQKKQEYETVYAKAKSLFLTNPVVVCYMWFVLFYTAFSTMPLLIQFQGKAQDLAQKYNNNGDDYVGGDNSNSYYGDGYNANGGNANSGYYSQSNSNYNSVQAMKCNHFSHEKVIIAMGLAWTFLIMGCGALVISFCLAYNADSVFHDGDLQDKDNNVDDGDYYSSYYPPPQATITMHHKQCGTFDDASEAPNKTNDPVLNSRKPITPPRQSKESATQTTVEMTPRNSSSVNKDNDKDASVILNPNQDSTNEEGVDTENDEKRTGNDKDISTSEPTGPTTADI